MITSWRQVCKIFLEIRKEAGNPNINLVTDYDWNTYLSSDCILGEDEMAMCHTSLRLITVKYKEWYLIEIKNSIWHEILHILFPSWPHWKIECSACVLAPGSMVGRFMKRYNKTIEDVPCKLTLIKMIRRASKRLNAKV